MKQTLLITASTFPRYGEDTEPRFILDLAKSLLPYANVVVLVPAAKGALDREILEGVTVIRYHYFPIHELETLCYPGAIVPRIKEKKVRVLLVPWLFCALYWKIHRMRKQYDIALANWLIPQGIVQSFLSKPYYVVGHGGDVTSLNKGVILKLKRKCILKAKGVVAVSKPLLDIMEQINGNHIKNSTILSMGCDTGKFGKKYRVDQYFGQGEDSVLLFVGRLAEKKGVTYLIEAMKEIQNARLVIVGDGPLRQMLEAQVVSIGMHQKITFLGAKTHDELREIYASADLFVMPSVTAKDGDKEGFGLVMLEAFASGLPVVASNSGGIKDLVKDGVNGYLVPEKDNHRIAECVNHLLQEKEIYNKMKINALETAQRYDYRVIGEKYAKFMELYQSEENRENESRINDNRTNENRFNDNGGL